jgi:hypothetical protein
MSAGFRQLAGDFVDRHRLWLIAAAMLMHAVLVRCQLMTSAYNIDYLGLWSVPHTAAALPAAANIYDAGIQRQMGARLTADARDPLTSVEQRRATQINDTFYDGRVDATGTPLAYAAAGWLGSNAFAADAQHFQWLSLLCFLAAIGLWCRLLRFSLASAALVLGFFGCLFAPINADIAAGNLNQVQLLAAALYVWAASSKRPFAAGAALGIGVILKPDLIYVLAAAAILDLALRRLEECATLAAGASASIVVGAAAGAAFFGRAGIWMDFLRSVPHTLSAEYTLDHGNYGLPSLMNTIVGSGAGIVAAAAAAAACLAVLITVARARPTLSARDAAFLSCGVGAILLVTTSGLAWVHYFSFLVPAALFLLRPSETPDRGAPAHLICTVAALCLMVDPLQLFVGPMGMAILLNAGALLIGAALALDLRRTRARAVHP